MTFATNEERKAVCRDVTFTSDFVVRVRSQNGVESEIVAVDFDHALDLNSNWSNVHKAPYVEIFRVLDDGSINPTIGPCGTDFEE